MRVSKWQREVSDAVSWHQDQALAAKIFILRETGPTSFLLKEDGEPKKFKVSLGDPHTCTCSVYKKENNPCKHICWILLKKFKLQRYNELAYQCGLVEREINQLLQGPKNENKPIPTFPKRYQQDADSDGRKILEQRMISEADVCPICQEVLLDKHQPVTYCKHGCGNNVHIECMKIWADHQRQTSGENNIKCPVCRENFGSFYSLLEEFCNCTEPETSQERLDVHFSTSCEICHMSPIKGKCYKCTTCSQYHICNSCYHANKHTQHDFEFRVKRSQRWRPAKPRSQCELSNMIFNDISSRDITENDYDLLLQLDRPHTEGSVPVDLAGFPQHLINRIPVMKVRPTGKLLAPGKQCRICLRSYQLGQYVRKLPACKHIFHRDCIDKWLSEDHRRCPIDKRLVFESSHKMKQEETESNNVDVPTCSGSSSTLMVPGIGISRLQDSSHSVMGHTRATSSGLTPTKDSILPSASSITFGDLVGEFDSLFRGHKHFGDKTSSDVGEFSLHNKSKVEGRLNLNSASKRRVLKGRLKRDIVRQKPSENDQKLDLWITGNNFKDYQEHVQF